MVPRDSLGMHAPTPPSLDDSKLSNIDVRLPADGITLSV